MRSVLPARCRTAKRAMLAPLVAATLGIAVLAGCGETAEDETAAKPSADTSASAAAERVEPIVVSTEKHCGPVDQISEAMEYGADDVLGLSETTEGICRAVDIAWNYGVTDLIARSRESLTPKDFAFVREVLTPHAARDFSRLLRTGALKGKNTELGRANGSTAVFALAAHGYYFDGFLDKDGKDRKRLGKKFRVDTSTDYIADPKTTVLDAWTYESETGAKGPRLSVKIKQQFRLLALRDDKPVVLPFQKTVTLSLVPKGAPETWLVGGWVGNWRSDRPKPYKPERTF